MPLTAKQEAFARAYVDCRVATEAYRRAYNATNMTMQSVQVKASRLMDHEGIKELIAKLQAPIIAKAEKDLGLTKHRVLEGLMSNATKAAEDADYSASNQAWKLLGMELNMFVKVIKQDITYQALTTEELMKALQENAEALGLKLIPQAKPATDLKQKDDGTWQ